MTYEDQYLEPIVMIRGTYYLGCRCSPKKGTAFLRIMSDAHWFSITQMDVCGFLFVSPDGRIRGHFVVANW